MRKIFFNLRSSLWFVPTVVVLIAIALAFGLTELDARYDAQLHLGGATGFFGAGAQGARGMLEAIAGSMITVAGLAFSITIVTLSLASTQYTPRILRNFMRDRANQSVLGVFVGIYAYCLIVLRTIRDYTDEGGFVPHLAVFGGVLLALLGIAFLIFFIHHIASSIQASSILDAVSRETIAAVEKLFPPQVEEPAPRPVSPIAEARASWQVIPSPSTGYIQSIDVAALRHAVEGLKATVHLEREVGEFVVEGAPLLSVSTRTGDPEAEKLRDLFVIGSFRTVDQDVAFGIRQIVDIALKALSPGVNSTTTSVLCLDYLSAILSKLAPLPLVPPYHERERPQRIFGQAPTFAGFMGESLDEIRLCAGTNVTVYLSLLGLITRVAYATTYPERKAVLLQHARLVADLADGSIPAPYDRGRVNHELEKTRLALAPAEDVPLLAVTPKGVAGFGR